MASNQAVYVRSTAVPSSLCTGIVQRAPSVPRGYMTSMTSDAPIRILVNHIDPIAHAGLSYALWNYEDFQVVEQPVGADAKPVDVVATDFDRGLELLSSKA